MFPDQIVDERENQQQRFMELLAEGKVKCMSHSPEHISFKYIKIVITILSPLSAFSALLKAKSSVCLRPTLTPHTTDSD